MYVGSRQNIEVNIFIFFKLFFPGRGKKCSGHVYTLQLLITNPSLNVQLISIIVVYTASRSRGGFILCCHFQKAGKPLQGNKLNLRYLGRWAAVASCDVFYVFKLLKFKFLYTFPYRDRCTYTYNIMCVNIYNRILFKGDYPSKFNYVGANECYIKVTANGRESLQIITNKIIRFGAFVSKPFDISM